MASKQTENWYYSIELEPGKFSRCDQPHQNIALTRALLREIDLHGLDCLDIGTQEALLPVLMLREGAASVTAYDRWSLNSRIDRVKLAYSVDFEYLHGFPLTELTTKLTEVDSELFDVVVFSGVLYHLINPLGLLAIARSRCRVGGLFIIETAIVHSQEMLLHFNAGGELYGPYANYFLPTTACLEYFLHMLCLKPVAAIQLENGQEPIKRVALACRSMSSPQAVNSEEDVWLNSERFPRDLEAEYGITWPDSQVESTEVPYVDGKHPIHQGLFQTLEKQPSYKPSADELILRFDSRM